MGGEAVEAVGAGGVEKNKRDKEGSTPNMDMFPSSYLECHSQRPLRVNLGPWSSQTRNGTGIFLTQAA